MDLPGTSAATPDAPNGDTGRGERAFFIARQPIFDRHRKLSAYELLFRGEPDAETAEFIDGSAATAQLIIQATGAGDMKSLSGGHPLFVNFTHELLVGGSATLLEPKRYVIEVLEDVPPEPDVLETCRALVTGGYRVALDDVTDSSRVEAFARAVTLVKVDLLASDRADVEGIVTTARRQRLELLAEKVETQEDLDFSLDLGFDYFQGFFLSRPESVKRAALPGLKPIHMKLLDVVNRPELDVDEVARTVEADPSLTYHLLRRANSAARALNRRVTSMREVVVLFGHDEIRRAATFTVMGSIVGGSDQILHESVTLARFCDDVGEHLRIPGDRRFDFYMVGLLSNIDALLGEPMKRALRRLPLRPGVVAALANEEGQPADALALARAYMRADWSAVHRHSVALGIDETDVPGLYLKALETADAAMAAA